MWIIRKTNLKTTLSKITTKLIQITKKIIKQQVCKILNKKILEFLKGSINNLKKCLKIKIKFKKIFVKQKKIITVKIDLHTLYNIKNIKLCDLTIKLYFLFFSKAFVFRIYYTFFYTIIDFNTKPFCCYDIE